MVMEAEGEHVKISESECPKPPSDDTWKWWQIFILLIIIIAVLVVYGLWKKCSKTSKCLTRVKEEKAVERVGGEEEEEAAHLRRPEMERDAEVACRSPPSTPVQDAFYIGCGRLSQLL